MSRKRHTPEQIIRKLREAEVELAKGQTTGDCVAFIFGMVSRCQAPISGGERKARRRDLDSGSGTFAIENKIFSGPFEPVVRIRFDDVEVTFES